MPVGRWVVADVPVMGIPFVASYFATARPYSLIENYLSAATAAGRSRPCATASRTPSTGTALTFPTSSYYRVDVVPHTLLGRSDAAP